MSRPHVCQNGISLIEVLASLPLAAMLLMPLAQMVQAAFQAQQLAVEQLDAAQQARFAMHRMLAAVRVTAPKPLTAKPLATSGDWLSPVTFCRNSAAELIETTPADTSCAARRVIAERVTAFAVRTYDAGIGAKTVIEISLSVTGQTGQVLPLTERARMGGAGS